MIPFAAKVAIVAIIWTLFVLIRNSFRARG